MTTIHQTNGQKTIKKYKIKVKVTNQTTIQNLNKIKVKT